MLQAALTDRSAARSQTQALVQMRSGIAWSPTVLSGIILVAFASLIYIVLTRTGRHSPQQVPSLTAE